MHLAFVIENLDSGGAERVVTCLAEGLIDRGHMVDIVLAEPLIRYPVPDRVRLFSVRDRQDQLTEERFGEALARRVQLPVASGLLDWMRAAGAFHWDPFCLPSRRRVHMARGIACYMAREQPDCVLPSVHRSIVATFLACRLFPGHPPIIPVVHDSLENQPNLRAIRRYRRIFADATHFIGVSRGTSDSLETVTRVPSNRITTIYNPAVTPHLFVKMQESPCHPWLLYDGTPVVLAVGQLAPRKDYPTLIKAFARVVSRRPCRLIILGEGSKRTEIEELVKKYDLTDRVSLPGWTENPFAFMSRASLFVLSSSCEGFSMVLAEALACGCPVVSTDCPSGPAEILRNGDIGPLVPIGDDAALSKAMEHVLDQPSNKQMLQQRAMDFSADRAVAAYEKLLLQLVG